MRPSPGGTLSERPWRDATTTKSTRRVISRRVQIYEAWVVRRHPITAHVLLSRFPVSSPLPISSTVALHPPRSPLSVIKALSQTLQTMSLYSPRDLFSCRLSIRWSTTLLLFLLTSRSQTNFRISSSLTRILSDYLYSSSLSPTSFHNENSLLFTLFTLENPLSRFWTLTLARKLILVETFVGCFAALGAVGLMSLKPFMYAFWLRGWATQRSEEQPKSRVEPVFGDYSGLFRGLLAPLGPKNPRRVESL